MAYLVLGVDRRDSCMLDISTLPMELLPQPLKNNLFSANISDYGLGSLDEGCGGLHVMSPVVLAIWLLDP